MRVGIDLGTTNTVVSYVDENGCWEPLKFGICGRIQEPYFLPSCIAVKNGSIIVGQPAVDHGVMYPDELLKNTKYDMADPSKEYQVGGLTITPVMAAEYILKEAYTELKRQFPSERSFNAFVTVPARFRTEARVATKTALKRAGFEIDDPCLTDEPVSAAIAYSSRLDKDKLVLVVDIGGGTFDLSLLKTSIVGSSQNPDRLEPVGWGGELRLGGNDVDDILVKQMAMKFLKDSGKDLYAADGAVFPTEEETRAAAAMRSLTLEIKKQLYAKDSKGASVFIGSFLGGRSLDFSITREEYEDAMSKLSLEFSRCLENLFVGTAYTCGDVDHVLVVGGMAHEICLLGILERMFGAGSLIVPEDSMLLVSKGAAICNSNLRLHVENIAYSSIGLLKLSGTAVQPIISEGSTVNAGDEFEFIVQPERAGTSALMIELVEYQGKFDPAECTVIMSENIQLSADSGGGLFGSLFGKKKPARLSLKIRFTEDKLLKITVIQSDGTQNELSLRLGGK